MINKSIRVLIVTLGFTFFSGIGPLHSSDRILYKKYNIINDNVKVTAMYYIYKGYPVNNSPYEFELNISGGKNKFIIQTMLIARNNYKEAISDIRKGTGWKGGYLFIPSECGGGNAWRCNTEHVFAFRKGKLIRIGELGFGIKSEAGPGSSYDNEYFYDYYDRLENNNLTSHAGAPGVVMVMREVEGVFVVDLENTWIFNANRYVENKKYIDTYKTDKKVWPTEKYISPLLGNAVLSKFCDRKLELESIVDQARMSLDADRFKMFIDILGTVNAQYIYRK